MFNYFSLISNVTLGFEGLDFCEGLGSDGLDFCEGLGTEGLGFEVFCSEVFCFGIMGIFCIILFSKSRIFCSNACM
jgi:hypothetical protein